MKIQESLNTALMGRTGVMVTTAVTRAQSADTIFVLEAGRVVESGSHQELWDQRGSTGQCGRQTTTSDGNTEH